MPKSAGAANNGAAVNGRLLLLTGSASRFVGDLGVYCADNLDEADGVEREIEQAIAALAANPKLGHFRRDLTSRPVRFWAIYSYLIIYDPESRPLEVVRILSGYRDVAELLK